MVRISLEIVSLASKTQGCCLALENKSGITVFNAGSFTLPQLSQSADISLIRNICITDFTQKHFGNAKALLAACEESHRRKKNIRELRLMGPRGIKQRFNNWQKADPYLCCPLPVGVCDGRRWFWGFVSFEINPKTLGYIYYSQNKKVVYLPQVPLNKVNANIKDANLLIAGVTKNNIERLSGNPEMLRQELRKLNARKILLIPVGASEEMDEFLDCARDNERHSFRVGREGMTAWVG